jgi:hypothetical protein
MGKGGQKIMATSRSSQIMRAIPLLITIFSFSFPACAQYSGGSGTAEDPYQIATATDLIALGESPGDYDRHFILTANIDLDPRLSGRKVFDRAVIASDWNTAFNGVFDGNNHTISHLTISGNSYLGLFGVLGSSANVSNLGLEAVQINATGDDVGGLAGNNRGSVTSCYSTGSVSGDRSVGGLVGENHGSINICYSTGTITGDGKYIGGLAGLNEWGSITSSYSTGSVTGNEDVGGLVGFNEDAIIMSCYSTGAVTGDSRVGGLVGTVAKGGFTATCFWDMETSGQPTGVGGVGLTTIEMMDPEMLGLNGLLIDDPNWVLDAGRDYPRLAWEGTPGQIIPKPIIDWLDGQGTEEEPYRIYTANQLILLTRASALWDKHFILGADIDLDPNLPDRHVFSQAVIQVFSGVFDGNGHTISHLTITGDSVLGLFGRTYSGARISNLGLEAVDVNGIGDYVGGLTGYNRGSITDSYCTGSVSGNDGVGGLVGNNAWSGSITNSYSAAMVHGNNDVGGLVGLNEGDGSITTSVWDMETSGLTVSAGGIGLTTAEMMDPYILGLNGFANDPNWTLDAGRDYPRLAREGTAGQIIPEPVIDWMAGQGTEQEPYHIYTADQLILLIRASGLWDKHFILGADIDLDPNLPGRQVFSQAVIPVFSGVFDGNDHTISHLTISGGSQLGLFGQTGSGAWISNLALEAVDVNGIGDYVGGLTGYNRGSITDSYCTGSVAGDYVGGLVGCNSGSLTASHSSGSTVGGYCVGGLLGYNDGGTVTTCYSTGSVSGVRWCIGGLVGENSGSISLCHSTGAVSGNWGASAQVGGLVGMNSNGSINSSYNTGSVTGGQYHTGGLVGYNGFNGWGSITTSYSTGAVNGDNGVGGLVGGNSAYYGSITTSYSTGAVTGDRNVGGLVGENISVESIISSFWDIQTSDLINMCGFQLNEAIGCDDSLGKTTAEMQTASTFLDAGWDFINEAMNGTDDIWWIDEGQDYPRLWWEEK